MEYLFLEHTFLWLIEGGVLLMVVPQERLDSAIPLLAGNFTDLRIFRQDRSRGRAVRSSGTLRRAEAHARRALRSQPRVAGTDGVESPDASPDRDRNTLPCAILDSCAAYLSWLAAGPSRGRRSDFFYVEAGRALPLAEHDGWMGSDEIPRWSSERGRTS
jgi:hypothetical protein